MALTKKQEELKKFVPKKKKVIELFPHQRDCLDILAQQPAGSRSLVTMATGLGKTGTFTHIPLHDGKILIIASGNEIVYNPIQYYDFESVGVEMGQFRAHRDFPNAKVIIASVQSLVNRLEDYFPTEFRTIVVDEAHHATAPTYKKVIDFFKPQHLVGFTATPNRSDGVSLGSVFESIVFSRDLKWAIKNDKLCDICLTKVKIDIDLRNIKVKRKDGESVADFSETDIAKAMAASAPMLKKVFDEHAFGQTIICVAGVKLAEELAALINKDKPGTAVAIIGDKKKMSYEEREKKLQEFREKKIKTLVSVNVLKEGVDLPCTETLIMARPTLSSLLYTQIVGRGLRKYPKKKYLNLIEIEGVVDSNVTLCSAPCLFGIDLSQIPEKDRGAFNKRYLTEMEDVAMDILEDPSNWLLSKRNAKIWADTSGYDLHNVNWLRLPDGGFEMSFPVDDNKESGVYRMALPPPDTLGRVAIGHTRMPFQVALDLAEKELRKNYRHREQLWNIKKINEIWGKQPPSEKQKWLIKKVCPDIDVDTLNKQQASDIIAKIQKQKNTAIDEKITYIYPVDPETPPEHWTNVETVSIDRAAFQLYDYDPGPDYVIDAKKELLAKDFTSWLRRSIQRGYNVCEGDTLALITRINKSKREGYGIKFMSTATKYSYICRLDGIDVSRRDLMLWFAQVADQMIPCILDVDIIHKDNPRRVSVEKVRPKMNEEPLSHLVCQFPDTEHLLAKRGKRYRLPKVAEELRSEEKTNWLEQERKKAQERDAEPKSRKTGKRK